jgi:hypothetical protein
MQADQLRDRQRRVIRVDGSVEILAEPRNITQIRALLGASALDTVQLRHLGAPRMVMFVDDGGHAQGLPVNRVATALYLANCYPGTTHEIRGDVAIVPDQDYA